MGFFDVFKPKQTLCPYCFEYFELAKAPFRCRSTGRCPPEPDAIYTEAWYEPGTVPQPMGKVLAAVPKAREVRCDGCRQTTFLRICPCCHMTLPDALRDGADSLVFAVVGAKNTGKSHFIAVLVEQLREVCPGFDISVGADDATLKRYAVNFRRPLYEESLVLQATMSGQAADLSVSTRIPLVYMLTLNRERNWKGDRKVVTLVFYDTAGEDMNSEDVLATVSKYIYRSNGIILLLDPLQLKSPREQLPASILPPREADTFDIVNRLTNLIINGTGLRRGQRIAIPLAVAFSKFDAVLPLVDGQYQIHQSPRRGKGYDLTDFKAVDAEMRALVGRWSGGDGLLDTLTNSFATTGFFGLSALGHDPKGGRVARIVPRRVTDPLLWLMYKAEVIPPVTR